MKFSQADSGDGLTIDSYEPGCIVINERSFREGLILSPEQIISGWGPANPEDLTVEQVRALVALEPQVIIIGTGERQVFPHPEVYAAAMGLGVGVEIMNTGAACRTYNIIMAEGRRVAAGLMILE